jgi:predicted alpha/beta superfamily hydrolase
VPVYGSIQFDMPSKISGRTYRIFVFKPASPPPPAGYPVVITLDANMTFPIMATLDATFALAGKAALVIGVGYAVDDPERLFQLRYRDLTPATLLSNIQQRPDQPPPKLQDYGGAPEFYRFLVEELRPAIADAYCVDAADQTLYGHSIAGMFALYALLNYPGSFRNFVASSPSIWWNACSLLSDVPNFERMIQSRAAAPRVLILVGAKEQHAPATLKPETTDAVMKRMPFVPSALRNIVAKIFIKRKMLEYRMVDNARELAACLQRIKGARDYAVRFHAFEDEDHLTALAASVSRALVFALRP